MRDAVLSLLVVSTVAAAPEVRADPSTVQMEHTVVENGPHRLLLATGVATFGFAYGVSAWVGATTDRMADRWLLVPLAGPWVALARREGCDPSGTPCDVEPTYRGLLVADGLLQLAGVAQLAVAFVERDLRRKERPVVRRTLALAPGRVPGGAALAVAGTF